MPSAPTFPHLMAAGRLGTMELRNRIIMCPMGDNLSADDGTISPNQVAYYEARARGGAALLLVGSVSVAYPLASTDPRQAGASHDRFLPGLADLTERAHRHGARIAAQLVHNGQVALYDVAQGQPMLVPSVPKPARPDRISTMVTDTEMAAMTWAYTQPSSRAEYKVATEDDIAWVIERFADAAERCQRAGFDGVELHAGHGYLIDEFLTPSLNTRTDGWGGPVEARARLLVDIVRALRGRLGDEFPVWARINAVEHHKADGERFEDQCRVVEMALDAGIDAVHLTAYGSTDVATSPTDSYVPHVVGPLADYSAALRARIDARVPLITFGRFEPAEAEEVLAAGKADFIAMGRKLLADPDLPAKLAAGRVDDVRPCIYQYRCIGNIFVREPLHCVANASTGREDDDERLELALLYRHRRQYAHGRQCAVDVDVRPGDLRAWQLRTTSFPAADVLLTVPAGLDQMPGLVLDMARLGSQDLARDDLVRALRPLVTGYRAWLDEQADRLGTDTEIARYGQAGPRMIMRARRIADRLERVIDLLRDNPLAREAIRFANQAMALQRVRTELVRTRLAAPDRSADDLLAELDVPERRSWRPFQLAFVLLCLPGLTDPAHPDAHRSETDGEAQLLFFPTGGGKTESYLGLTAYTFAIRRLQGVIGSGPDARDGTDGVAVLMRYTLRLLTAQRFARAASLVCACEELRRERIAGGDTRWGATPFRVGLWVGSSVTPNTFEEAQRQVEDDRGGRSGIGGVLQLVACPWCGCRLSFADLRTERLRRRVLVFCSDPEGRCPFTERRSPGEGLPVLTVDEELYRLTPALVIATVDKLAQLPWKAATATLFGLVTERCARHGWRNPDFDDFCRSHHLAARGLPATQPESVLALRPPDLIIQDELHLISDALGSMVGLYETVIDHLASRPGPSGPVRPVLVASTATVRRAADQVEQVFDRDLAIFPPQVLDAGRTFFSHPVAATPQTPARRYRGIMASGERMTSIEIRVVAAALEHAQHLIDHHGAAADPYMTVVDYFTSTRDLASMRRLVDDDIADRLTSQQVRTRRRRPNVAELTSRMPSDRIATTLADLEQPFDPTYDTTAALDAFRAQSRAAQPLTGRRPEGVHQPLDVLLATSMLQVGVDVPRLGLMAVTGQPKNTAEYIQATSRVGRDPGRPGLVLAIYQWARPRDLAHYETFGHYHATFGAMIEG